MFQNDLLLQRGFTCAEGRHLTVEGDAGQADWSPVSIPHDGNLLRGWQERGLGGAPQGFVDCYHDLTYRVQFPLPSAPADSRFLLLFEGVYRDCSVWVNGKPAGTHRYGYTSFYFDVTSLVRLGDNLLEVYVDNRTPPACRWYSGMGLYRDVHLITVSDVHTQVWGTFVTTPSVGPEGADVHIRANLQNDGDDVRAVTVSHTLYKDGAALVSFGERRLELEPGVTTIEADVRLSSYERWDLDRPALYTIETVLREGARTLDCYATRFGIRTLAFQPERGFFLNERPRKLQGVDLHHDSGCLGAAFLPSVWKKRLLDLKALGVNAIRTSHNPQAPAFYDLCDELGLLVFDEAFDKWNGPDGYYTRMFDECWQEDLTSMLRRDCNHPSVIIWSVGNEVQLQGTDEMCQTLKMLTDCVRAFDPTRPVTFAMEPHNNPIELWDCADEQIAERTARMMQSVDLLCGNYSEHWYEAYHRRMPDKLVIGTEIFQYYSSIGGNLRSLTDTHPWEIVRDNDWVIGGFIWAGTDYLGESSGWPARGWTGALVDLAYGARPQAGLWRAYWSEQPTVSLAVYDEKQESVLAPTWWSAPKMVRHLNLDRDPCEYCRVAAFTNCETVELFYNGERLGERAVQGVESRWNVCLHGGELVAVGKNGGVEVCRDRITGFDEPAGLAVRSSLARLNADPHSAAIVEVELLDARQRRVYRDGVVVRFELSEDLVLLGVDNGDARSHHDYHSPAIRMYQGRAVAVVQARGQGERTLRVSAEGLAEQTLRF